MHVPKGDILHRFRRDVQNGELPAVSWIVAPQHFSDHPDSPWFGAWYLAEIIDILTRNPAVWKKTIFILCYDENDGYFDHVPPFVPPHPDRPESGRTSPGLDTTLEFVTAEQEEAHRATWPRDAIHVGPVGLGYRVPLVIASPWSRGGYVCSQVFDHTSIVQFLEKFISHKTGRSFVEPNLGAWRRTVCGDLTSVFRPAGDGSGASPAAPDRLEFMKSIDQARFRPEPRKPQPLDPSQIVSARDNPLGSPLRPRQEPGTRPSCSLPYELSVHGGLSADRRKFVIRFAAGRELFGERAAGAPFHVYSPAAIRVPASDPPERQPGRTWAYAVEAGDAITDEWTLDDFEGGAYHLRVHGPNGFFREFRGDSADPRIEFAVGIEWRGRSPTNRLLFRAINHDPARVHTVTIEEISYGQRSQTLIVAGADSRDRSGAFTLDLESTMGWYDLRVRVAQAPAFEQRFAGRLETGRHGTSDPAIGRSPA
jgi:phospholipase C